MNNEVNVPEELLEKAEIELNGVLWRGQSHPLKPTYAEAREALEAVFRLVVPAMAPAIRSQECQRVEELQKALQEAEDRFESCDNCERPTLEKDLKVVWCREPESGEQVDARICAVCRLEVERDEAVQQERQRIAEECYERAGKHKAEAICKAAFGEESAPRASREEGKAIAYRLLAEELEDPKQPAQRTANGGNGPGMDGSGDCDGSGFVEEHYGTGTKTAKVPCPGCSGGRETALSEGVGSGAEEAPKCERCGGGGEETYDDQVAQCGDCYGTGVRHVPCPKCETRGCLRWNYDEGEALHPCDRCHGRGYIPAPPPQAVQGEDDWYFTCRGWDKLSPESKEAVREVVQATARGMSGSLLSDEEREEYDAAKRSVVDARNAALSPPDCQPEKLREALEEVAIPSLRYCEEKFGHDDQARLNLEAALREETP